MISQEPLTPKVAPEDFFGATPKDTYKQSARETARKYKVNEDLFEKLISQESGFNPRARSNKGASGMGQFMPGTGKRYGLSTRADFADPYKSLDASARHMRDLLDANDNDEERALAAYNAGQGRVNDGSYLRIPETRNYIKTIRGFVSDELKPKVSDEGFFNSEVAQPTPSAVSTVAEPETNAYAPEAVASPKSVAPARVAMGGEGESKLAMSVPAAKIERQKQPVVSRRNPQLDADFKAARDRGDKGAMALLGETAKGLGYEVGVGDGGWTYIKPPKIEYKAAVGSREGKSQVRLPGSDVAQLQEYVRQSPQRIKREEREKALGAKEKQVFANYDKRKQELEASEWEAYLADLDALPPEAKQAKAQEIAKLRPLDEREQIVLGTKGLPVIQELGTAIRGAGKSIGALGQGFAKAGDPELQDPVNRFISDVIGSLKDTSTERQNLYGRRGAVGEFLESGGRTVPLLAAASGGLPVAGAMSGLEAYGEGKTVPESIGEGLKTAGTIALGNKLTEAIPMMAGLGKVVAPVARYGGRVGANVAADVAAAVATNSDVDMNQSLAFGAIFGLMPQHIKAKAKKGKGTGSYSIPEAEVAAKMKARVERGEKFEYDDLSRDEQLFLEKVAVPTPEQKVALQDLGYKRKAIRAMSPEKAQGVIEHRQQQDALAELGYNREARRKMSPEQAEQVLNEQRARDAEYSAAYDLAAERDAARTAPKPPLAPPVSTPVQDVSAVKGDDSTTGNVQTFKTAKGSTYAVNEDGTTTRNKSFHPEHGEKDQGMQPQSEKTYYVSAEDAQKLGEFQAEGEGRVVAEYKDGRIGVKYTTGKDAGKFESRTMVTPKASPEVGLIPVESFKGGKRVHFGNEIVEVSNAQSGGASGEVGSVVDEQGKKDAVADYIERTSRGDLPKDMPLEVLAAAVDAVIAKTQRDETLTPADEQIITNEGAAINARLADTAKPVAKLKDEPQISPELQALETEWEAAVDRGDKVEARRIQDLIDKAKAAEAKETELNRNSPVIARDEAAESAMLFGTPEGGGTLSPEVENASPRAVEAAPTQTDIRDATYQGKSVKVTSESVINGKPVVTIQGSLDTIPADQVTFKDAESGTTVKSDAPPTPVKAAVETAKANGEDIGHHINAQNRNADGKVAPGVKAEYATGIEERRLPGTLEKGGFEGGDNRTYTPETLLGGAEKGKAVVADKGIDASYEWVKNPENNGIEWASVGYEAMSQSRAREAGIRATDPATADAIGEKRRKFAEDFAVEATKRGQAIAGIRAIAEFAPDRAVFIASRMSKTGRKHGLSAAEEAKMTEIAERAERKVKAQSRADAEWEVKRKEAESKQAKDTITAKKNEYKTKLAEQSQAAMKALKEKLGLPYTEPTTEGKTSKQAKASPKLDLFTESRPKEKGAVKFSEAPLEGDAELLAQYTAGRLGKVNTVAEMKAELIREFGQEVEPTLDAVLRRAATIEQEARLAEMAMNPKAERKRTILDEISADVAARKAKAKEIEKAEQQREREFQQANRKAQTTEARQAAKATRDAAKAEQQAEAKYNRERLDKARQDFREAREAERKALRAEQTAGRKAEKQATVWDRPLRNEAAEARERLKSATDAKTAHDDLVAAAAEYLLPKDGKDVPRMNAIFPGKFYSDLRAEFPSLVTKKNQSKVYKDAMERVRDSVDAAKEVARQRSANAESKKMWDELGIDEEAQAILLRRSRAAREANLAREDMAREFQRVSRTRLKTTVFELANLPRALQSSIDAPIGRQGLFYTVTHPINTMRYVVPATVRGYKSLRRGDYAKHVAEMQKHPDYELAKTAGLDLPDIISEANAIRNAEEDYASRWGEKLLHVRLSEQGFTLGMNTQRLQAFARYADFGKAEGYTFENNPEFFQQAAHLVNAATGRGNMPELAKKAAGFLNTIFYSTRLQVSRVQLINDLFNPVKYVHYDPVMRKIAMQEALRGIVGFGLMFGVAAALKKATDDKVDVTFDPRSPDFGKIRVGNQVYDITGGNAGMMRYAIQFVGAATDKARGVPAEREKGMTDILLKFGRSKLAPIPGAVVNLASAPAKGRRNERFQGSDFIGKPANLDFKFGSKQEAFDTIQQNQLIQLVLPMLQDDVMDAAISDGWIGAVKTAPAVAGFGVSTYPKRQADASSPSFGSGIGGKRLR